MKNPNQTLLTLATIMALAVPGHAGLIVNDTWRDGTRTDPASPSYSEYGTDADVDGDLESAWYRGGDGTLAPVGLNGPLRGTTGGASSSWTTYFTPEATPLTLANPGDLIRVTWVFTPTGVAARNTSQGFRVALVDSPSAQRLTVEGSPPSGAYTGYAMFMNMGVTLGHSSSFPLMERNVASGDLLATSGNWAMRANGIVGGNPGPIGYADGTQYTFVWTFTRTAGGELDILATMTGGNIGGTGQLLVSFTDSTPNTFTFDTFAIRPSSTATTASQFDTSLFRVEFIPEPSTWALLLAGAALLGLWARRRRG